LDRLTRTTKHGEKIIIYSRPTAGKDKGKGEWRELKDLFYPARMDHQEDFENSPP
jgi:hypothetical protein